MLPSQPWIWLPTAHLVTYTFAVWILTQQVLAVSESSVHSGATMQCWYVNELIGFWFQWLVSNSLSIELFLQSILFVYIIQVNDSRLKMLTPTGVCVCFLFVSILKLHDDAIGFESFVSAPFLYSIWKMNKCLSVGMHEIWRTRCRERCNLMCISFFLCYSVNSPLMVLFRLKSEQWFCLLVSASSRENNATNEE